MGFVCEKMALLTVNAAQCNGTTSTAIASALPGLIPKRVFAYTYPDITRTILVSHFFRGTLSLKPLRPLSRPCRAVGTPKIVARSGFADHEATRFRDGLLKMLADDENMGDLRVQMVDTCTKIFQEFAMSYSGELPMEPFVEMRRALEEGQGIPLSIVSKVTRGAIGWSRYNLYRDWKKWSTSN